MARQIKRRPLVEEVRPYGDGGANNLVESASTAPTAPPGAPLSPTSKTSSSTSANSLPKKCSPKAWPARPTPPTRNPPPPASVRAVSDPWPATRPILASSRPGPARPTGPNPKATAPAGGGLFFPPSKSPGIDQTDQSPAVQQKVVYAGIAGRSFAQAACLLEKLAALKVSVKQVERLPERIGGKRVAERDRAPAAFEALPLAKKFVAPAGVTPPDLAVVMADGGRLQIRDPAASAVDEGETPAPGSPGGPTPAPAADADWAAEPPPKKGHWREDKVGLLLSMQSDVSATDPCPDIAGSFLDVPRIPTLARELKKNARAGEDAVVETEDPEAGEEALQAEAVYQAPEVRTRQVVASRACWPSFAPQVAAAAWALGFQDAARQAFVGDGSANNWTPQRRFFGSVVPILDVIHPWSYGYAAAQAGRTFAAGWATYQGWIAWVWQGKVAKVIAAVRERQADLGMPGAAEAETSPARVVSKARTYVENHQDKRKYDAYRKQGLPITSSLMESTGKQINQRGKGSEKVWAGAGSEPGLHLRADQIRDSAIWEDFWDRRQAKATGQRRYRRSA